jgi:hypothetical protein
MIQILDPAGQQDIVPPVQLNPVGSLRGRRIAVLDNGKPGAERLGGLVASRLAQEHGMTDAGVFRKFNPTLGADPALLDKIAASADLVVTGTAD